MVRVFFLSLSSFQNFFRRPMAAAGWWLAAAVCMYGVSVVFLCEPGAVCMYQSYHLARRFAPSRLLKCFPHDITDAQGGRASRRCPPAPAAHPALSLKHSGAVSPSGTRPLGACSLAISEAVGSTPGCARPGKTCSVPGAEPGGTWPRPGRSGCSVGHLASLGLGFPFCQACGDSVLPLPA